MNENEVLKEKEKIAVGNTHGHTCFSNKDGLQSPKSYIGEIKRRGGYKLAITDHGTLMGIQAFVATGKDLGVEIVPAVELYIKDENDPMRYHLCAYAMDEQGWKAISLLVTESNTNLEISGKLQFPCTTTEMLTKYFGEGSIGHGHVLISSACIQGVLCGIPIAAEKAMDKLSELEKGINSSNEAQKVIEMKTQKIQAFKEMKNELTIKQKTLTKEINSLTKKRTKLLDKGENTEDLDSQLKNLQNNLNEVNEKLSGSEFLKAESEAKEHATDITQLKKRVLANSIYLHKTEQANALRSQILSGDDLTNAMIDRAKWYDNLVGHGYFYIELQYHGMPTEKRYMPMVAIVAKMLNIPVVASNDEHFTKPEEYEARRFICSTRYPNFLYKYEEDYDKELYVKGDGELAEFLYKILDKETVDTAIANKGNLLNRCHVEFNSDHHYPRYNKAFSKEDTRIALEKISREGIPNKYPNWNDELEKRLQYELGIIDSMGFNDYFLITQDFLNIGRKIGHMPESRLKHLQENTKDMDLETMVQYINEDQSSLGLTIGPGRGSGAGSIVCYLTGITSIDPIKYNLIFERFLNPERVSMPDIDSDFANAIRPIVIEYVKKKYGYDGVCSIMTNGTLAAKAAIKDTAKVYGSKVYDDNKHFLKLGDKISAIIPNTPGAKIADSEEAIKTKFANTPDEKDVLNILHIAKQIEGTIIQVGLHAAGVVISDNGDIKQYCPLMWDEKKSLWKSQWDKDQIEAQGLLKMDFLGLLNLDMITDTLRILQKEGKEIEDVEQLAYHYDPKVIDMIANAETNSVFQFESNGMKSMLKQFKPTTFEDLILLVAAYRPGPMQFLPEIIKVKHGLKPAEYLHPILKPILESTYGAIVYQEQVMQIFQTCAGYSLGGADLVRRAMGKKKMDKLLKEKEAFISGDAERGIKGCKANGISEEVANKLFEQMTEFANYAFNKSHAAAYATIAYITAYLKYYFPAEYLSVVMGYVQMEKIPALVQDCKKQNITVHVPDVNESENSLSIHNGDIYFGFKGIKGLGVFGENIVNERNANGEFSSISNFIERTSPSSSVLNALIDAGAFDSFICNEDTGEANRTALAKHIGIFAKAAKTKRDALNKKLLLLPIREALTNGNEEEAMRLNNGKKTTLKSIEKRIAGIEEKISNAESDLNAGIIVPEHEDLIEKLNREKEALGVYISAHPLDVYEDESNIDSLETTDYGMHPQVLATINGLKKYQSAKTGKYFAFFELETKIGNIEGACFKEELLDLLETENNLLLTGYISTDQEGEKYQFFVTGAKKPRKKSKVITIISPNPFTWQDHIGPEVMKYKEDGGEYLIIWKDMMNFGEIRETGIFVGKRFLNEYPGKYFIQ